MSRRLYESAVTQLRGLMIGEVDAIERQLANPEATPEKVMQHAQNLTLYENAITVLQAYIGPRFEPKAPPTPPSEQAAPEPAEPAEPAEKSGEPRTITPEMSATYAASTGKADEVANKRKKAGRKKKKKDESNDAN